MLQHFEMFSRTVSCHNPTLWLDSYQYRRWLLSGNTKKWTLFSTPMFLKASNLTTLSFKELYTTLDNDRRNILVAKKTNQNPQDIEKTTNIY